jgi:hypothetical protein
MGDRSKHVVRAFTEDETINQVKADFAHLHEVVNEAIVSKSEGLFTDAELQLLRRI